MEEFKSIEDYPIVGEISQEELSKYDDYIEKSTKIISIRLGNGNRNPKVWIRNGRVKRPMSHQAKEQDHKHRFFAIFIAVFIVIFIALSLSGCKTVQGTAVSRDSIRVELRHDSVYVYQHDSIFRDRWRAGDTVYVTLTQYKTLYRDRLHEVHDTIALTRTETVTVSVPRPRTAYDRFTSWFFWIVVVILLAIGAFKVCDMIPATKPYTTMIKGIFKILK